MQIYPIYVSHNLIFMGRHALTESEIKSNDARFAGKKKISKIPKGQTDIVKLEDSQDQHYIEN